MCAICTRCTKDKGDLTMGGNDPVNIKTFGGVNFNWNQVKAAKVRTVNGQKMYFIEFKTGVTAEYPMQEQGSMRSRELTMWQSMDYDTETILNDMKGVTVKGSKKDDHIVAKGITDSTIDVSQDKNDDHIDVISSDTYAGNELLHSEESYANTVILDDSDSATKTQKSITYETSGGKKEREKNLFEAKGQGVDNRF